jgi:hypothetical protein
VFVLWQLSKKLEHFKILIFFGLNVHSLSLFIFSSESNKLFKVVAAAMNISTFKLETAFLNLEEKIDLLKNDTS